MTRAKLTAAAADDDELRGIAGRLADRLLLDLKEGRLKKSGSARSSDRQTRSCRFGSSPRSIGRSSIGRCASWSTRLRNDPRDRTLPAEQRFTLARWFCRALAVRSPLILLEHAETMRAEAVRRQRAAYWLVGISGVLTLINGALFITRLMDALK
jgi:hypothetical protein